ncbi:MAG: MOP flippase family protein [Gallionellaceae bacterium]
MTALKKADVTLRKQTFSGVRWTAASSLGRAVLQVIQVAILARLLAPTDFGLIAIVLALMAFLQIFADAGVSNAIIHYQNISREQLSSLYWLNVSVSVLMAIMLVTTSPWLADLYSKPVLQSLFAIAAAAMVVSSLAQQLRINAQKELRFDQLATLELAAALCGFATTVGLAWAGAGVYALAVGSLVGAVAGCVLAWLFLAHGWRPQWRLNLKEIRPFLKFGGYMVGNNLANTFNTQIDVLLGAHLFGAQEMGLYSVPKNLTLNVQMVINPIVSNVGLPVMAKAQGDSVLLKRVYLQTMRMTASVNFPIYVGMALFAPEIVHLMLGEKWQEAIPLLQIFSCWGLLRSIGNPAGSLLFAVGKVKLVFRWNMVLLIFIGPTIWLGSLYGVQGMAFAMTGLMAFLFVPGWYFLIRPSCGATLGEYSMQLFVPLVLSIIAGIASYSAVAMLDNQVARLMMNLVIGMLIYLGLSWLFNRVWLDAVMELVGK